MGDYIKGFLLQIQFLTRLPVPVKIPYTEKLLVKGFVLAPLVGLLVGGLMTGCYALAALPGQRLIAVFAVLLAEVLLTGGLHLDGFADTCDGLFSGREEKEKILSIMHDSRIGVFGALGLILLILGKGALLSVLDTRAILGIIVCMPVIGRINVVWLAGLSAPVGNKKGMGAIYAEHCGWKQIAGAGITGIIPLVLIAGCSALLPLAGTLAYTLYFSSVLKKRLGGATGDTFGYIIETTEFLYLALVFVQEALLR